MESQMTIGKKISLMCALLVIFTVTLGVTSLVSMTRMDAATQSVVGDALPGVYFAGRVESMAKDVRAAMTIHIGSDKAEDFTQLESTIAQGRQNVLDALKEYEKTITRSRDRELHARMAPAFEQFLATWEKPRSLSRALKPQEAMAVYRSESVPAFTVFQKAAGDLLEFNRSSGDE
ncbi:MAG: MCP four helix bundle domain-containing protein, partial [Acidobacteriota bacterium]